MTCKRRAHTKIDGYREEFVSLEEAVDDLEHYLKKAIESKDTSIHVIKAQVGIGKTHAYIKSMARLKHLRFLIALSTNLLKNEVGDRVVDEGVDMFKTPSLHEIKPEVPIKHWDYIEMQYKRGQYRKVHPYIKRVLAKENIPCLRRYMEQRDLYLEAKGNIITTHKKLLHMDEESLRCFDVILVDEDIVLKSIMPNHTAIPVSELKKLAKKTTNIHLVQKIKDLLKCIRTQRFFTLDGFEVDQDDLDKKLNVDIDIPAFCSATHFCYRDKSKEKNLKEDEIVFMNPVFLKDNVKYIIVSATADESVYRDVFGDRVKFYECRTARYKGVLNQYVGKSFSRVSIDNSPGIFKQIIEKTGIKNIITFMKYALGPLYIGNVEGSNIFEAQDLNVVATPYEAEFIYKLFLFSLDVEFDIDDEMEVQTVARNGYLFQMNTYHDEKLRNLQLWMIESQLEQAVGRARLLRHDCVVNLFSNYPLRQAKILHGFFSEEP